MLFWILTFGLLILAVVFCIAGRLVRQYAYHGGHGFGLGKGNTPMLFWSVPWPIIWLLGAVFSILGVSFVILAVGRETCFLIFVIAAVWGLGRVLGDLVFCMFLNQQMFFSDNKNDGEQKETRVLPQGKTVENTTLFSIEDIAELRRRAQEADNPLTLLAQFSSLRLKEGFSLCTLENLVGYVWAIPLSSSPPELENCEMVDLWNLPRPFPIDNSCLDGISEPGSKDWPKPRNALNNVMDAIQGDGTPLSYMQASIFAREAAEFHPMWHGYVWSTHTILGGDPWTCPHDWEEDEERPSSEQDWHWLCRKPSEWRPSVILRGRTIRVRFYTYSALVEKTIYCYSDTYAPNSYKFGWDVKKIAVGGGGYIF